MRNSFEKQLFDLNTELIAMGALCESAIESVLKALVNKDLKLCDEAIRLEKQIDEMEQKIEALCLRLLLLQQPVARDLRQISAALKMITDMERIGDQASDIAEIVVYLKDVEKQPEPLQIQQMARATGDMVHLSVEAFVKRDKELAARVIESDDLVDELFQDVRKELINLIAHDPQTGEMAIDLIMIAKYFERIGDHATNIAEWVEFSITGVHRRDEA